LIENGIDYVVVDNDSIDGTAELLRRPDLAAHLIDYRIHPYAGHFDWQSLIEARQAAADPVEADWILYVSADEIMHSDRVGETLAAAIERIDASGYDVIDFDEFVFLPVEAEYISDHDRIQPIRHYYFFQPTKPRLMRARKKSLRVSHAESGGHVLTGEAFRLALETFALRHYMFRSQAHAFRKYTERSFNPDELLRGWHGNRHGVASNEFTFPPAACLDILGSPNDRNLSRGRPRKKHYWQWESSGLQTD
jgi:glycosyltransferase involved in cell wall biosynthesis